MKIRFAVAPRARPRPDDLAELLTSLEASGFDGVWLSDVPIAPLPDPLVGLAFAAARTARLKLGANVVPLGRNPYLLAKALAQVDRLSGGRLLLSFVPGIGRSDERAALGSTGRDRGPVLEQVLTMARAWWRGEAVTDASPAWSFDRLSSPVRPVQDPLEVWLGGHGPRALERVGRLGDGWLGALVTPSEAGEARRRIDEVAVSHGRNVDPEHFGMSLAYSKDRLDPAALEVVSARRTGVDPSEVVPAGRDALRNLLGRYVEAGVSKFVLRPLDDAPWPEELDWLGEAVLDLQT